MNDILELLKKAIILSYQDLIRIRSSISKAYAHLSSADRAEILSLAVHNLIDKHLHGVDEVHKDALKISILKNTLSQHVYTISKHDVFESIISLDLPEEKRIELAESWLLESNQLSVPKWALENHLNAKHPSPKVYVKPQKTLKKQLVLTVVYALVMFLIIGFSLFQEKPLIPSESIPLKKSAFFEGYQGICRLDRVYLFTDLKGNSHRKEVVPFGIQLKKNEFGYEFFHYFNIKHYIASIRNGVIAHPEYFNRIIHIAYLNDIDPILLLAIIGQEQAFVSKESSHALLIVNNPFNVFHSWTQYNTTLHDSTRIAINTIKNRMAKKPLDVPSFLWLNGVYAEDPNWHIGVNLIYSHLKKIGSF